MLTDTPEITDAQYDALMNELKRLEAARPELVTADSPTQRVGGKPKDGFAKVRHSRPLLSLDNAYDESELRAWEERVRAASAGRGAGAVCVRAEAGRAVAGAALRAGQAAKERGIG